MSTIALDLDPLSANYGDILIASGQLSLISGVDEITQNVLQNLRTFLTEWFLDTTVGVPWFQQILVKNPERSKVDAVLINAILSTPGIQGLLAYSSTVDEKTRSLSVAFKAQSTQGIVNYAGLVA